MDLRRCVTGMLGPDPMTDVCTERGALMATIWPAIVIGGFVVCAGFLLGTGLVDRGFIQLALPSPQPIVRHAGGVATALAGAVAVLATRHAGSWWLLPALLVWAYTLASASVCDAATQRIPTPLVWRGALVTAALTVLASAATGNWRWAALATFSAVAAGLIMLGCWRFVGGGFGDVRLAVLGGLGLAAPTHRSLTLGVAAFTISTLVLATLVLARGGTRKTQFPFGPSIALAVMVTAVA